LIFEFFIFRLIFDYFDSPGPSAAQGKLLRQTLQEDDARVRHRDEHGKMREPLLDGLSTTSDLDLFREAQAMLAHDMVSIVCLFLYLKKLNFENYGNKFLSEGAWEKFGHYFSNVENNLKMFLEVFKMYL